MMKVPRIGLMRVDDHLHKPMEVDDKEIAARVDRTNDAAVKIEAAGCGASWAQKLGKEAIARDANVAARDVRNPFFALAYCAKLSFRRRSPSGRMGAVAAHHGHSDDVFCTLDHGRGAGTKSLLHRSRRQWLETEFGVANQTPTELASRLRTPRV
jgi:hypothetical protein